MTNQNIIANCSINIGLLNARSMLSRNSDINKPIAIHELITDRQYDIFAITETWLKTTGDEASIVELTPINYVFINQPRPKNTKTDCGGGVGLMYRRDLCHAKK